jgi:hypothetical protein
VLDLEPVDSQIGFECSSEITARFDEFGEIVRRACDGEIGN